ncbi:hypothetical protein ACQEU8_11525 [Streptomyces sp. CA-250714]|uniref:hypothetical protein n=1 Tax=Streptomyces sp. CA-250714 TaxID=3240060 RepID=UPI003D8B5BC7
MRTYVGHHEAWDDFEFEELAYGIDRELFLGTSGETAEEAIARLDAQRDILSDLREQGESDEIAAWDALFADQLARTLPLMRRTAQMAHRAAWGDAA